MHSDLLRRIEEAEKLVPIEPLAPDTLCGFASVAARNKLTLLTKENTT